MSNDDRLEREELVLITRQFAGMLDAGIDILRILEVLRDQFTNPKAKEILLSIERDMRLGRLLWTGLGRDPEVFSPFYISLIRQGELEGVLAQSFNKVAERLMRGGVPEFGVDGAPMGPAATALVYRITPIAFWLTLSTAVTLIAIAGLWDATMAQMLPVQHLGPNILLLVGIFTLVSSLVFARLRPKQWTVCSFCGRSQQTVAYLRRSPNGAICDACIEGSYLAWQAQKPRGKTEPIATPPAAPASQEIEVKQIESHHVLEEEDEEIIGEEFEVVDEKDKFQLP